MIEVSHPRDLARHVGTVLTPAPMTVSAEMVDMFLAASGDGQWIHGAGAKTRVVPGNYLIALLPRLMQGVLRVGGAEKSLTTGYDKLRFPASMTVGEDVAASFTVTDVRARGGGVFATLAITLSAGADGRTVLEGTVRDFYVID
jgi:acyl dehydratase